MSGKPAWTSMRKALVLVGALVVVALCAVLAIIALHGNPASWQSARAPQAQGEQAQPQPLDAGGVAEQVDTYGLDSFSLSDVPAYTGEPFAYLNGNAPYFDAGNASSASEETYSPLDELGRCGTAVALVSEDIMPTEPRGSISNVHPTGWQTTQYDWIEGKLLFNRCHLIAFQLSGENDNEKNLITGTRYMNATGMLPFENEVAAYVHQTKNHVYYRVTPVFEGDNLVASGVIMEAESFEDSGAGVRFCVWCYNVEPGVVIDYATGENQLDGTRQGESDASNGGNGDAAAQSDEAEGSGGQGVAAAEGSAEGTARAYVLNTNTMRFHYPDCPSVTDMQEKNKREVEATREELLSQGYIACGRCTP